MNRILDKIAIDAGIQNPSGWHQRTIRKNKMCDIVKTFVHTTNLACVTMPKKGKGTNFTVGKVNIRIGVNHITIDVNDAVNSYDRTGCSISMWCFKTLDIDEINSLIIVNDKIAISYI